MIKRFMKHRTIISPSQTHMSWNRYGSMILLAFLLLSVQCFLDAQTVRFSKQQNKSKTMFSLSNDQVSYTIVLDSNRLLSDVLSSQPGWVGKHHSKAAAINSDADFSLEIMWTDWQAPRLLNNAENPLRVTKRGFLLDRHELQEKANGGKSLSLYFHGEDIPLLIRLAWQLDPQAFYVKRKLAVADTALAGHFLQMIRPVDQSIAGKITIVKEGGFGQPVAFLAGTGGGFLGVEYPAAENVIEAQQNASRIRCGYEVGSKIDSSWLESEWVVEGISPNAAVKQWFMRYVNNIRVAPLRPFTLYNSWYDLRSPEYPGVPEEHWMNETNIRRIIGLVRQNMIEKHHIPLDAFVLDDGWDVYQSDWALRSGQFPSGLKPIADELKKTNTTLGMWLGPTGGYSFRMKRVDWMKAHGYEVVGHTRNTAMLCLAGTNYSNLFEKRVGDFVGNDGVGYFKWDGIQFSCSEPDHGHPIGIYSRHAVMESVIGKCAAVREKNLNVFLNITSGTWLSPWWVKYANTIWMQGQDYGYADVPSISPRDAAITYRDFVLYDDFKNQKMWFPIANLMTHGIIKGKLEMLGGTEEPLEKFTNEVMLYLARGVAMWELYVSPDILTDGEWDAIGNAMRWAKDRFPILSTTEMIGGDPMKRQAYGYTHFREKRGIIAVRNPWIGSTSLKVKLATAQGLDPDAAGLVVEKVYPTRWVSPQLYKADASVDFPLEGYETAIYEIYPLTEARSPLVAGVPYALISSNSNVCRVALYGDPRRAKILNPEKVGAPTRALQDISSEFVSEPDAIPKGSVKFISTDDGLDLQFTIDSTVQEARLAILLTPDSASSGSKSPVVILQSSDRQDTAKVENSEGTSRWYTHELKSGGISLHARIISRGQGKPWSGKAAVWSICHQLRKGLEIDLAMDGPLQLSPMPPKPLPIGVFIRNIRIGEASIKEDE